jgi:choline kinase
MRAVILAAGRGGRLRGIVGDKPKCLARVGDCTLIERQIRTLRDAGVDQIAVVTGFRGDAVRRVCGPGIEVVHNTRFARTNSLYSLWLARDLLLEGFLALNCDVLFHPRLLVDLLEARYEDALLVCTRGQRPDYSDEEMKVCIRRGLVCAISKGLSPEEADAENVGVAKFGAAGAALIISELNRLVGCGEVRDWLPRAFASFAQQRPLHVVESRGYPWIEIDFPEDYWQACSDVLPAIEIGDAGRRERSRAPAHPSDRIASDRPRTASVAAAGSERSFRHV